MLFAVDFYDKEKVLKSLQFEQPSEDALLLFLKRQGIIPVSVRPIVVKKSIARIAGFKGVSLIEKETMARHLSTLIKIGTPLMESVSLLIESTKNSKLQQIYRDMIKGLEQGKEFSSVFAQYPKEFPESFTAVVRTGEATGTLDQAFELLADQLRRQRILYGKIKGALVYPIVLTFSVLALLLLITIFVLPRIAQVFSSFGTEVPATTKLLIGISTFMNKNIFLNLVIFVAIPIGFIIWASFNKRVRIVLMTLLTKVPGVKTLITQVRLARIARGLHTMIKAGLPLTQALEIISKGMKGSAYEKALKDVTTDVSKGISLTNSLKNRPELFPGMFVGMMRIGEKTATLDQVLGHMADFYEEETADTLGTLSTFIEPALLIFIGLIVLFIALAVLVPIYKLVSSIG